MQTVEFQHVHVITVGLISGNKTAFSLFKHILEDFLCADFIFHAEERRNSHRGHILGVFEKLKHTHTHTEKNRKN